MVQMLIEWSGIEVSIISGVYRVVANVYDIMMKLVKNTSELSGTDSFSDLILTCYVLAGVFMLFRVAIALVQMLVNPELINDKQAGAGKMITRLVLSIILLLLLRPDGFLFAKYNEETGEGGLLGRIEYSLVTADDGFVRKIITSRVGAKTEKKTEEDEVAYSNKPDFTNNMFPTSFLVEDVQAASMKKDLTCYFVQKGVATTTKTTPSTGEVVASDPTTWGKLSDDEKKKMQEELKKAQEEVKNSSSADLEAKSKEAQKEKEKAKKTYEKNKPYGIIKLTFSSSSGKGKKAIKKTKNGYVGYVVNHVGESENVSVQGEDGKTYNDSVPFINYYDTSGFRAQTELKWNTDKLFIETYPKDCNDIVLMYDGKNNPAIVATKTDSNKNKKYSSTGGYKSLKQAYIRLARMTEQAINDKEDVDDDNSGLNDVIKDFSGNIDPLSKRDYLKKVHEDSIRFAQEVASSFQECGDGKKEDCEKAQKAMFVTKKGNDDLANLAENGDIELGFLMSMIGGIGITVYLIFLCVEIIIRRYKLLLLEVMSPIPAISYIDPKDKVFNQWLKIYVSTYLDLFIKLIAISLAIGLLKTIFDSFSGTLLEKFFYIVAILVFAKAIPSLISKIFGLDSMGSSFKDILGMGRSALRFGSHAAAIGGGLALVGAAGVTAMASNAVTGFKKGETKWGKAKGVLGGVGAGFASWASGVPKAIGAGSKGDFRSAADNIFAKSKDWRLGTEGGSTAAGRAKAKVLDYLGYRNPYEKAQAKYDAADAFLQSLSGSNEEALKAARKAASKGSQLQEIAALREADDALAAHTTGGKTWQDFVATHGGYDLNMSHSMLTGAVAQAEKEATAQLQADAFYAQKSGKTLEDLGYNTVGAGDTEKIATQVENIKADAHLLGQTIEIGKSNGRGSFVNNKAIKNAKEHIEQMKADAKGDMIRNKADHDMTHRG